jgi:hypothetical protein
MRYFEHFGRGFGHLGVSLGVSRRQGDTGLRYEEVPCLLGKIELLKER